LKAAERFVDETHPQIFEEVDHLPAPVRRPVRKPSAILPLGP
jgi:hypothetical protein